MKSKNKSLYKRLSELSLIVSGNLPEVDIEYVKEINEILSKTRVSVYSNIFEDAIKYYKTQKKLPDFEYVNMHFPELMEDLNDEEPAWHESFALEYLSLLQKDELLQEIALAQAEDDLESIDQIITSNERIFNDDISGKLPTFDELFQAYENIKNSKPPLKFGIRELDKMYNGLCYGTCNILAAPPGKFKTTTANSIAYVNLKDEKKVLYITLEDSWDVIYFNIATRESYEQDRLLNASTIKIGRLDEEDEQVLKEVIEDCKKRYKNNFRVACQQCWADFTPAGLLRLLRKAKKEMNGLDLVVLDHASLMKFYKVKGVSDPKEIINFYIRYLTNLSISFEDKFALLVAMQTNRDGIKELESGKTGSLTNLAEANEAERSASTVTLIYSGPNAVESNIINFYPKKNRRGYLSAKPIISFIEPGAYFVGERAIEGDVSLDDLMDDMDSKEDRESQDSIEDNEIKGFAHPQKITKTVVKKKRFKTEDEEESNNDKPKPTLMRRKIKKVIR